MRKSIFVRLVETWLRNQTRLLIDSPDVFCIGTVVFVFTKGNQAPGNV